MREIKFRAWDTHEEVMNRVDYIDFVNGVIGMSNENVRDYEQPIHRANIMQYTGLKDKNDVMIYEGDIVETPYSKTKYLVDYVNGCFVGRINYREYKTLYKSLKVIGNVYENPELLEREAE